MTGIEIEGLDEFEELLKEMTITDADERKAMRKAIEPIASEVEKNTPEGTGKLKDSVTKTIKKDGFGIVGIVRMGKFYDIFEEFGTSQQKKNVGFFERSVNSSKDEAIQILAKELLK